MNTWNKPVIVKGVSFFDGVIDGKEIKSGTVYIEEQMDEKAGTSKGFRTVAFPSTPEAVKKVFDNEFPINADVTFSMKVTKNANIVQVDAMKFLNRVGGVPKAA